MPELPFYAGLNPGVYIRFQPRNSTRAQAVGTRELPRSDKPIDTRSAIWHTTPHL